jgi:hypothetical protein
MNRIFAALRGAALAVLAAALVAVTGAAPAQADNSQEPPPFDGVYALRVVSSSYLDYKCVEVGGWRSDDLAPVDQYSCHYGQNQQWLFARMSNDANVFFIRNINSGKCLDVLGFSQDQGAPVVQYSCHLQANQQWQFSWDEQHGLAQFRNVNSGQCLSVDGLSTDNLRAVVQNPCYWWATNEQFYFVLPPNHDHNPFPFG